MYTVNFLCLMHLNALYAETISMPPVLPENELLWPCPIDCGRNSTDSTIVHLVNLALEGFAEIPAPEFFLYTRKFSVWDHELRVSLPHFGIDDVQSIQDWIFEVAALWQ